MPYFFRVPYDEIFGAVVLKCKDLWAVDSSRDRGLHGRVHVLLHDGHHDLVRVVEAGGDATTVRTPTGGQDHRAAPGAAGSIGVQDLPGRGRQFMQMDVVRAGRETGCPGRRRHPKK